MKRIFLFITLLASSTLLLESAWSQDSGRHFYKESYASRNSGSFSADHSILSLGVGVVNLNGISNNPLLGPITIKYEHGIIDEIGIGGFAGASFVSRDYKKYTHYRNTFALGVMGYYHFNKLIPVSRLDVFAGLGVGVKIQNDHYSNNHYESTSKSNAIYVFRSGARWYFTPKFAAFGEVGSDRLSSLTLGLTFKL